jgi:hypothetical protein
MCLHASYYLCKILYKIYLDSEAGAVTFKIDNTCSKSQPDHQNS